MEEDRNKPVVTAEGRRVGTVRNVDDDRATVDRDDGDDGITSKIKDMLGWGDDDSNEVRHEHVDTIEDDSVRLRQPK